MFVIMKSMMKKPWVEQILLSLGIALILVAGDFLFFWMMFQEKYPRHWTAIHETFGLVFLLSLAFRRRGFYLANIILLSLAFVQMAHLSFFGNFVHPTKIYLFFTNLGEVGETLGQVGKLLAIPVWVFGFSLLGFWGTSLVFKKTNRVFMPMRWVLLVAVLYIPIRTAVIKDDYGKQPAIHNMAFSNLYSSFSYFFARTLPFKLSQRGQSQTIISKLEKTQANPQVNVVFILGESLRYQNLELFGYPRATTPNLIQLSREVPFVFRKGIAGGVCTDVAIPMFINNYQSTAPMPVILGQEQCLFKLAKNNGFETHFYSAQAEGDLKHIVNYICTGSIDHMTIGPGISLMEDKDRRYYDDILVRQTEKLDFSKPQFLVLHQRGSHSPYNLRYPADKAVFPVSEGMDMGDRMITEYDNSVAYTDVIVNQLVREILKKSKIPTYFIFTSDHGQILGENKSWGHNDLNEYVFKVPFVFVASQKDAIYNQVNQMTEIISHKEMSDLIVQLLGYQPSKIQMGHPGSELAQKEKNKVFVMGYDLDGLEGGMWIDLGKDKNSIEAVHVDDLSPLKSRQ